MSFSFSSFDHKVKKVIDHLVLDLKSLRTGRASGQLLDPVRVEAYGAKMKLVELANVSAPDPNLLVVSPWDRSLLSAIEKAIASAGLNFNPVVDGELIRITVPPLTQERRQELIKTLHQKIEGSKVVVRTIRTETKQEIEKQKSQGNVSEDDIARELKKLEENVQIVLAELDKICESKESELTTV